MNIQRSEVEEVVITETQDNKKKKKRKEKKMDDDNDVQFVKVVNHKRKSTTYSVKDTGKKKKTQKKKEWWQLPTYRKFCIYNVSNEKWTVKIKSKSSTCKKSAKFILDGKKQNFNPNKVKTFSIIKYKDIQSIIASYYFVDVDMVYKDGLRSVHIPFFQLCTQVKLMDGGVYKIQCTETKNIMNLPRISEQIMNDFMEGYVEREKNTDMDERLKTNILDTLTYNGEGYKYLKKNRPSTLHPFQIANCLIQLFDLDMLPISELYIKKTITYTAPMKFNPRLLSEQNNLECTICFSGIKEFCTLLPCMHSKFCMECAKKCVDKPCPLCKVYCTNTKKLYF